jgi:hypothetical protein
MRPVVPVGNIANPMILIGNSIEGLPDAEIMPKKLAGGISVVKVKFPLTALCGQAVRRL